MKHSTSLFLAFSAILAAAIAFSGQSQASTIDDVFISVLKDEGIDHVNGDAGLIAGGHDICDMRAYGYTEMQVVDKVHQWSELDLHASGFLVGAAEAAYCPWEA